jgi:hypothetical protein
VIHLYAFARKLPALPTATGLADTPLERVDVGGIAAIFTTHGHDELEPSRDLALVHGRVITLLDTHAHDVLPVRFGERFGDVEQLRAAVGERRLELEASFARVSGCVEIGLRLLDERRAEPRPASTGTEYMRALQASGAGNRDAEDAHRRLEALSRAARVSSRPGESFCASYLVPRSRVAEVRQVVERWTAEHPDVALVCTGPWAPFSFAMEAV